MHKRTAEQRNQSHLTVKRFPSFYFRNKCDFEINFCETEVLLSVQAAHNRGAGIYWWQLAKGNKGRASRQ